MGQRFSLFGGQRLFMNIIMHPQTVGQDFDQIPRTQLGFSRAVVVGDDDGPESGYHVNLACRAVGCEFECLFPLISKVSS